MGPKSALAVAFIVASTSAYPTINRALGSNSLDEQRSLSTATAHASCAADLAIAAKVPNNLDQADIDRAVKFHIGAAIDLVGKARFPDLFGELYFRRMQALEKAYGEGNSKFESVAGQYVDGVYKCLEQAQAPEMGLGR